MMMVKLWSYLEKSPVIPDKKAESDGTKKTACFKKPDDEDDDDNDLDEDDD